MAPWHRGIVASWHRGTVSRRRRDGRTLPGPDQLAPGWGLSANTPEAQIRQAGSIAKNAGRGPQGGWRSAVGVWTWFIVLGVVAASVTLAVLFR